MQEKICQSCAMPMSPEDYGTNKDGSKNDKYCQYCYKDGAFTSEETLEEMIASCAKYMSESDQGITEEVARKHLQGILPDLERWKR
ncbi:zinc ribbon domain-containing protein [Eubacteriales bacterium OttesenSCG-928-A19]|nr:zinc ribbon domain-containing protein [Eubacteriales bacterium OttesenSCG-928-A19]